MAKAIAAFIFGVVGLVLIAVPLLLPGLLTLSKSSRRIAGRIALTGAAVAAFALWLALN